MPLNKPPASSFAQCKFCGSSNVITVDSRPAERNSWRRRRRVCNECKQKWSTIELPVEDIESILEVTYKLDELSKYALRVHTEIEALKHVGPVAEAEAGDLIVVEPMTMRTQ